MRRHLRAIFKLALSSLVDKDTLDRILHEVVGIELTLMRVRVRQKVDELLTPFQSSTARTKNPAYARALAESTGEASQQDKAMTTAEIILKKAESYYKVSAHNNTQCDRLTNG